MSNCTASNIEFKLRIGTTFAVLSIVVNACSSIVACVLNFLIILTFVKTPSMRTPSYILILCLAIADFGVGAVVQPVYCAELFAKMKGYESVTCTTSYIRICSSWVLGASSLLTITAITIDRFLVLHLHLRYQELVTAKRSYTAAIVIAILSIFGILPGLFYVAAMIAGCCFSVLFLLNIVLMAKISREVSKHSANIHSQEQAVRESLNLPRYKKTVNTVHYIMGTFSACYIPVPIVASLIVANSKVPESSLDAAFILTSTLWLINSALNPVIYFWRIQDMRNAAVQLFRNIRCLHYEP
ncbi:G-protein coupled receptor 12-like [Exaiptasia diaphana]|uniref:G-protein coupled receptors family 1 profile domain-containing protein n=1 Tax=Exaiptasia diaphana TaxID=2652724 RepID=A0A913X7U9_EXADI|nr:G-protein coupled receptor 12-like [Exaiptasia diaphana]